MPRPELLEQLERMEVIGAWTRLAVEPRNRLQIVVHDVRGKLREHIERDFHPSPKVRNQHFDPSLERGFAHGLDAGRKMAGAAVTQIIAVDAGDDDVFES